MQDLITFMEYHWVQIENGVVTLGINDDGLAELNDITTINLPGIDEEIFADEIFGEINSSSGPLNIYSPCDGTVLEINDAIMADNSVLTEDSTGDGWLIRIAPGDDVNLETIGQDVDETTDDDD